MADAITVHGCLLVDVEDDAVSEFLFIGVERTYEVAQMLGKHGDCAVDEVDGCGALPGFFVDYGVFGDIVGHVGDVYPHFPKSVADGAYGEGIIEIFGIRRVDGACEHVAEVFAFGEVGGSYFTRYF